MFFHHIMNRISVRKRRNILRGLSGDTTYLRKACGNKVIDRWLVGRTYGNDNYHQMILNRNIRSHPYDHFSHDIEVELYYEYPNLLCELQELLHCEHELERTAIVSKFG